ILEQTQLLPASCQWATFLRNHDELTLEMVTDEERDYMYRTYAVDAKARINLGIRRRLAPLMGNNRRKIELMNVLLLSLPGTPILYYGDEIGMGDNYYLGDRNGVRTPMQWSGDRNAGFSRTDPARLYAPPIMDPVYGFQALNVEAQERSPYSLLNWMKRMIGLRKQFKVFGRGTIEFLPAENRKVLGYVRKHEEDTILCVANLARSVQPLELDLSRYKGMTPVEMLGLTEFPPIGELPYFLTLPGYAFYWFRLQQSPAPITARVPHETVRLGDAPALFVGAAWDTLLDGNVRTLLERDLLGSFLLRQRWFGGKARTLRTARFVDWGLLRRGPHPLFLTIVEVQFDDGERETYFLPLAICAAADAKGVEERSPHAVLARVTGARKGVLFDAWLDDRFARTLLDALEHQEEVRTRRGAVVGEQTAAFAQARGSEDFRISRLSAEQSNTSIVYGDRLILKLFRRLQPGINPDYEIGRQLTEEIHFPRVPAVAGAFEYRPTAEKSATLAMMQQFVESQADGWRHATDEVSRFFEMVEGRPVPADRLPRTFAEMAEAAPVAAIRDAISGYYGTAETLGRRTAEVHLALASDSSREAFAPEPFSKEDLMAVSADAAVQARRALDALKALAGSSTSARKVPDDVAAQARAVIASEERLIDRIKAAPSLEFTASKTRVHGDYHLGQVLWAEGDFFILDFEGEPARPLEQRRQKQSPLKDVAGMLRSFSYAAYAGLFAHASTRPGQFAQLEPWARVWQTWASAAFLKGYLAAAGGAMFIPSAPSQRDSLLQLFLLDKALYELNYELNNRPDWLRIPLAGIVDILRIGDSGSGIRD
ncbi:MAG: putative maltokinase, partial [Vicinamibacterales bacterium]